MMLGNSNQTSFADFNFYRAELFSFDKTFYLFATTLIGYSNQGRGKFFNLFAQ
jgi:hypothetical protein